jgi:tetratricopeptide (TPR) repeat protein
MDTPFDHALAQHRAGDLVTAEALYRDALTRDPTHADAQHLLGVLRHQQGRHAEALALIDQAVAQRPSAAAYTNRAAVLTALGRLEDALASHDLALQQDPNLPQAHANKAEVLLALSRHADAVASYDRALALRADHAGNWLRRGDALHALARHQDALTSYDRALSCDTANAAAWLNRGVVLEALDRPEDAADSYHRAVALQPDNARAHANRGNALHGLDRHAAAIDCYDRAIVLGLDEPPVWFSRANALQALSRHDDALASFDRALTPRPDYVEALNNRGNSLRALSHYDAAIDSYQRALAVEPNSRQARINQGNVLQIMNRHEEALVCYDTVLMADPEHLDARWNGALCRLALGDFARGWRDFEWRDRLTMGIRPFAEPLWLGEPEIAGRTILLHAEQGLGDTLQFCRYATLLAARGARVVLEAQPPLQRLLATLDGVARVVARGDALGAFDLQCPLMSLPLAFGTTLATVPAAVPYLHADPRAAANWRARLAALPGVKIGLVWAGNPRSFNWIASEMDRRRSIALAEFAPLASVGGISLISLQKDAAGAQARDPPSGMTIHDWTDELTDFADTAALVEALDLVIGVDTSVVHVAGALGKPVWILNRYGACWRWLRERTDTPWYPTARLFRQPRAGDWDAVMAQVRAALPEFVAAAQIDPAQPR